MPIFDPDSKFMQITSTMLDYLKLGLLFMLFSIPVIPMGAAAAAAMTVAMKIARGEAPAVWRPFWKAFKENFRQGTILLLIFGLLFALLGFDWYQVMNMDSTTVVRVARAGIVILAILLTSITLYSFAIIARYELPLKAVLRNAVIYTLLYFPKNLLTVAMIAAGILAYSFLTPIVPLVVTILPAVVIWYFTKTCVSVFRTSERRL
ncbi:MAG: DUF624 domain-containing protein [Faecousia sp.]